MSINKTINRQRNLMPGLQHVKLCADGIKHFISVLADNVNSKYTKQKSQLWSVFSVQVLHPQYVISAVSQ